MVVKHEQDGAAIDRVANLDGVRGIAILLTIMFHSFESNQDLGRYGERGVDLFFVLSGFLITGILIETRDRPNYFKNFYARRALRILPLYYVFIALMIWVAPPVLSALFSDPAPDSGLANAIALGDKPSGIWSVWVYLQNFILARGPGSLPGLGHLWSLAVEEQFYLVWPVVIWLTPPRYRFGLFVTLATLTCAARSTLLYSGIIDDYAATRPTQFRIDALTIGGIGALYVRDPQVRERLAPLRRAFARGLWIPFAILPIISGTLMYGVGLTLVAIGSLVFILAAYEGVVGPRTQKLLNHRLTQISGKYCYSLYLFHFPIAVGLVSVTSGTPISTIVSVVNFAITLAVSLGIAHLTWHYWEQPWLRLKKRFSYRAAT